MSQPNDLIIRVTRNDSGQCSHEVMIAINDDSMLPELEKLAEYINECLSLYGQEQANLKACCENLLQTPRIFVPK